VISYWNVTDSAISLLHLTEFLYSHQWPCRFFHKFNFCTNGDSCKFSHAVLTDETRPLFEKIEQVSR
jgi:Zinc finger C-x8-C-x5-C-x3-H type (and similar)